MHKLKAIQVFVTVVKANGFAAAAQKLNISAPSVSRIIRELEENMGVLLLKRTTRSLTTTEVGQAFFEDCQKICANLDDAEKRAKRNYKSLSGHLTVSAPTLFGALFITPLIGEFILKHPGISIQTRFDDTNLDLIEEDIDVAIRIGHLKNSSLVARKVATVYWILCGSPAYFKNNSMPTEPKDLNKHRLIHLKINDISFRPHFSNKLTLNPKNSLTVNTALAAKTAALSGWGLTQLLSYQVADEIHAGSLIPILIDHSPSSVPVNIIHNQGKMASRKLSALSDTIASALQENPRLD